MCEEEKCGGRCEEEHHFKEEEAFLRDGIYSLHDLMKKINKKMNKMEKLIKSKNINVEGGNCNKLTLDSMIDSRLQVFKNNMKNIFKKKL